MRSPEPLKMPSGQDKSCCLGGTGTIVVLGTKFTCNTYPEICLMWQYERVLIGTMECAIAKWRD